MYQTNENLMDSFFYNFDCGFWKEHTVIYFVSFSKLVCVPQHMPSHATYIIAAVDIFHSLYPSYTTTCEQQLVLGKLLNTVKWSTFCVNFIRVITILRWL